MEKWELEFESKGVKFSRTVVMDLSEKAQRECIEAELIRRAQIIIRAGDPVAMSKITTPVLASQIGKKAGWGGPLDIITALRAMNDEDRMEFLRINGLLLNMNEDEDDDGGDDS